MQVTLNHYDMDSKQLRLLAEIFAIEADKKEAYENSPRVSANYPEIAPTPETKPFQPELPFDGEIDTGKQKRTRRTKAEIENATKEPETVSEEVNVDEEPKRTSNDSKITMEMLKEKAQSLVREKGREPVKNVIMKYAEKLTEIKESDYNAIMSDFEAMD